MVYTPCLLSGHGHLCHPSLLGIFNTITQDTVINVTFGTYFAALWSDLQISQEFVAEAETDLKQN